MAAHLRLGFHEFSSKKNPLLPLRGYHASYLLHYLADLDAKTVVEERCYFDRDYLAEFSAFYSQSTRAYTNRCRRLHFFRGDAVTRQVFKSACSGNKKAKSRLDGDYLGFVVVRPIPSAPFGRTVLRWYEDKLPQTPRVTNPWRNYEVHLAGLEFTVRGLAWQQQDGAVGACATIALWSMLHSSAFDDHHAIPTTPQITQAALRTAGLGKRVFPSSGLSSFQILEAIKELGLAPVLKSSFPKDGFEPEVFGAACASLIRSGYPVLLGGNLGGPGNGHAVCAVGFRESAPPIPAAEKVELQDSGIQYVYLHDDNLGPAVRFEIQKDPKTGFAKLVASTPVHAKGFPGVQNPTLSYPAFIPTDIIAAVHEGIRVSAGTLNVKAGALAQALLNKTNEVMSALRPTWVKKGFTLSTQFTKLADYLGSELERRLSALPKVLSRVRLQLSEEAGPMSLHLGLARIGWGSLPLMDVLFDTSDSDHNMSAYCAVAFNEILGVIAQTEVEVFGLGKVFQAY